MVSRTLVALLCATLLKATVLPQSPVLELQSERLGYYASGVEDGVFDEEIDFSCAKPAISEDFMDPGEMPTIYSFIQESPHFTKLAKIVNISDEIVSLLNDTSAGITFFAVPDWALKPPHHKKPHHGKPGKKTTTELLADMGQDDLPAEFRDILSMLEGSNEFEDPDDDEKRKKFIKKIVTAILSYNILPEGLDAQQLSANVTFATHLSLSDGSLDGQPLRIRTFKGGVPPALYVDFISKVVRPDVRTGNGIMHVVNHPVFPPPSIFQELFLIPSAFSTLTSAIQRVDLTGTVDLWWNREDKKLEGTPTVTFFAPSNHAFESLPRRLKFFLFSPFGSRVLKKLLEFHVVPGIVLHSDYLINTTSVTLEGISEHVDIDKLGRFAVNSYLWDQETEELFSHVGPECCLSGDDEWESDVLLDAIERYEGNLIDIPPCEGSDFADWEEWVPFISSLRGERPSEDSPGEHEDKHPSGHWYPIPPPPGHGDHPPPPPGHGDHPPPPHPPPHRKPGPPGRRHPHHPLPHPEPIYAANFTLPTLLTNHTLDVHVAKFKLTIPLPGPHKHEKFIDVLTVNGQRVKVSDVPARNGAAHIIGKLLSPRHHSHPDNQSISFDFYDQGANEWEDWEEWLPQWAAQN